jgi:hypothetical protein
VVRSAVAVGRVAMAGQNDLHTHFGRALHYRLEVLHLEPQQYTVAVRPVVAVSDGTMMMLGFKAVQLQDELAVLNELLIFTAAMSPATAQQSAIPSAAGFDVGDADERLRTLGLPRNRTLGDWTGNVS